MQGIHLRALRCCDLCGSPVAGNTRDGKTIDFRRVLVERHFLDHATLREHAGLTLMLGSSDVALGSRAVATKPLGVTELMICNPCWYEGRDFGEAIEARKGVFTEAPGGDR